MYSSFFKLFFSFIFSLTLVSIFTILYEYKNNTLFDDVYLSTPSSFYWPLLNNRNITSYFGKRTSPTSGASSYHSGLDIAAPEGTPIYNCITGKVIFIGFKGAGGYTLTIENNNYQISYCHISPNFLFKLGDIVNKQNIIANVGPKNVYNVINNPYKDSKGNPTNGATTGCHLHLTIKKDGHAVNPLEFF